MVKFTVGKSNRFTIATGISEEDCNNFSDASGYFVITLEDFSFGLFKPDATVISHIFDDVVARSNDRGMHRASFERWDKRRIATAIDEIVYRRGAKTEAEHRFHSEYYQSGVVWAPDGDATFDDGSHLVQFDLSDNLVRLVGFKTPRGLDLELPLPVDHVCELEIDAAEFYGVLNDWISSLKQIRER